MNLHTTHVREHDAHVDAYNVNAFWNAFRACLTYHTRVESFNALDLGAYACAAAEADACAHVLTFAECVMFDAYDLD